MSEIRRILKQLDRAFTGEAWHGDSLMKIIEDVDAKTAASRPLPDAHTIWEIVLHIAHWKDVVRRRIGGERLDGMAPAQNWPQIRDASPEAWNGAIDRLRYSHEQLRAAIAGLSDDKLGDIVGGESFNYYFMLHGVIQHMLYHAGQVAVLKKGSGSGRPDK
jgi:uncharacterized damage-inducible protein DinB